jgi:hypothetical protein
MKRSSLNTRRAKRFFGAHCARGQEFIASTVWFAYALCREAYHVDEPESRMVMSERSFFSKSPQGGTRADQPNCTVRNCPVRLSRMYQVAVWGPRTPIFARPSPSSSPRMGGTGPKAVKAPARP